MLTRTNKMKYLYTDLGSSAPNTPALAGSRVAGKLQPRVQGFRLHESVKGSLRRFAPLTPVKCVVKVFMLKLIMHNAILAVLCYS